MPDSHDESKHAVWARYWTYWYERHSKEAADAKALAERFGASFAVSETHRTVWVVESRTVTAIFATEDSAKKYVAGFQASVGGGMLITEVTVNG